MTVASDCPQLVEQMVPHVSFIQISTLPWFIVVLAVNLKAPSSHCKPWHVIITMHLVVLGVNAIYTRVSYRIFIRGGDMTRQCYDQIPLSLADLGACPPP